MANKEYNLINAAAIFPIEERGGKYFFRIKMRGCASYLEIGPIESLKLAQQARFENIEIINKVLDQASKQARNVWHI